MYERFKQIIQFIRGQLDAVARGMIMGNQYLETGGVYNLN